MNLNSNRFLLVAAVVTSSVLACTNQLVQPDESIDKSNERRKRPDGEEDTITAAVEDEQPQDEQPQDEQPQDEQPQDEQPQDEQPQDEQPQGDTCGVPTRSGSCDQCARERCCEEQLGCVADEECMAWIECAAACESFECAIDCMTGSEPARQLATCWNLRCSDAC